MTFDGDGEVERLTAELADAQSRATEAEAVKRTFLNKMSHELRTPLNAIIGYSDILLEEAEDLDHEREIFVTDLEKIRTSGKNLLNLVNDLMDMAQIEAGEGELYYEELELGNLIRDVAHSVRELIKQGRNQLDLDVDPVLPTMFTDRTKVRQVLLELLRNAARFTQDGHIHVAIKPIGSGPDALMSIVVRDDGQGIPEGELENIFHSFRQADDSATREHDGAGLGLALCREFCDSLSGELTVKSRLGEGAEFTVLIPVVAATTRIEQISPMDVVDLWARAAPSVHASTTLEQAAQALAVALHTGLSESAVLIRVFVTAPLADLPDETKRFVEVRAEQLGASSELHGSTPVLTLIGTCGVHPDWSDRHRSEGHAGIPLISANSVKKIPMMAALLKDVGLPLDWMERNSSSVIQRTIGENTGLFFVENAVLATDDQDRKIIPAQGFVSDHGVGSVFGMSGAYSGDEILVVIAFCREQFPKAIAERFLPILSLFKAETASLVDDGHIFAE
jgi:nitrogen-specific signal transduction histidine kinase